MFDFVPLTEYIYFRGVLRNLVNVFVLFFQSFKLFIDFFLFCFKMINNGFVIIFNSFFMNLKFNLGGNFILINFWLALISFMIIYFIQFIRFTLVFLKCCFLINFFFWRFLILYFLYIIDNFLFSICVIKFFL